MNTLTPRRLRIALALFFIALAVPAAVLIVTAHDRLKWEAFHQYRALAEELAARIDARATQLVREQEAISFAEYGFLVVSGEASAPFVQRSVLSAFPVDDALPGLIGHFQVDAQGTLHTPLIPDGQVDAARFGVPASELEQRLARVARIRAILGENRLVLSREEPTPAAQQAEPTYPGSVSTGRVSTDPVSPGSVSPRSVSPGPMPSGRETVPSISADAASASAPMPEIALPAAGRATPEVEPAPAAAPPARPDVGALRERAQALQARESDAGQAPTAQAAFDALERAGSEVTAKSSAAATGIGRMDDLKLEMPFSARDARTRAAPATAPPSAPRTSRIEQVLVPADARAPGDTAAPPIRTFEGEIDPFQAALLDSGHLVMFRKVWRDGQRVIQGALLERTRFVEELVEGAFRGSAVAQMSNLGVAWRDRVFAAYGAASAPAHLSSARELDGALLYRTRLSVPLADMDLVFTVTRLPAGPGARVITWLGVVLAIVLCAGTALMYRLGMRQIALARQQRDFIAAVSHELRTPLTSIRMYAQMLREGWAGEDKKAGYYTYIHDESERLSRLITNVLELARISRDQVEVKLQSMHANELLDLARSRVTTQVDNAGFALRIACEPGAGEAAVRVDPDAFVQVIINLVDNALKFSARAEHKVVEIGCALDARAHVVFSVRDHGPGVARDQMRRIFGLFYRGGDELTRETSGTGIGLALVRRLCDAMDARVEVANANPGACFRVYLARA